MAVAHTSGNTKQSATEEANRTQRFTDAKGLLNKKASQSPRAKLDRCDDKCDTLRAFTEGDIHTRTKAARVTIHNGDGAKKSIDLRRELYQPAAWVLDKLDWTKPCDSSATLVEKRGTSITYLELACIVDTLTGGSRRAHQRYFCSQSQNRRGPVQTYPGQGTVPHGQRRQSQRFPSARKTSAICGGGWICPSPRHGKETMPRCTTQAIPCHGQPIHVRSKRPENTPGSDAAVHLVQGRVAARCHECYLGANP